MKSGLWMALVASLSLCAGAYAAAGDEDDLPKGWQEDAVTLPPSPAESAWMPFFVSAATENRFFVDGSSLSVGNDGVVRYALKVQTAGGARNVSYEGMRCDTREWRLYATGRLDGSWSPSRVKTWQRIQDVPQNRQHAALFLEYFCPDGIVVRSADEARDALRRGGHPATRRSGA